MQARVLGAAWPKGDERRQRRVGAACGVARTAVKKQDWVLGAQTVPLDCLSGLPFGQFRQWPVSQSLPFRLFPDRGSHLGLDCCAIPFIIAEGAALLYADNGAWGRCLWRRAHRLNRTGFFGAQTSH